MRVPVGYGVEGGNTRVMPSPRLAERSCSWYGKGSIAQHPGYVPSPHMRMHTCRPCLPCNPPAPLSRARVQHLALTQRDLEEWQANPEEYFHACDDTAWQERANLCAETLFLTLLVAHKALLCPLVVHMLQV